MPRILKAVHCITEKRTFGLTVLYCCVADLSECQLTQVPDAVFLLMKSVTLQSCSLASNLITKIPAKLPINFTLIKGESDHWVSVVTRAANDPAVLNNNGESESAFTFKTLLRHYANQTACPLVGAFSVIVQLCQLIVNSSSFVP